MDVRFISLTKPEIIIDGEILSPEGLIAYCARVSSPNQENPNYTKLLQFCIREGHWSIFEMVDMTLEITTTRAIAPQILRHRSFCFQEFSLRYSCATEYEQYEARRQDVKNRQNSLDDFDQDTKHWFNQAQAEVWEKSYQLYEEALAKGIAKECARSLLPLNTVTRLYMKGSVRSWIHYFSVRCDQATQKEHREIALAARAIFMHHFPTVAAALEWQ
ncbi:MULTISPECIES: FAD-dependent thymidylate synthase [unclassified Synechocystis]|uniref:FAD-dependent thymidylate synthase n=1 Tax=unclassified Synechocystis TaxID=2640012 RepID=UPI0004031C2E|nr:MULTISPECIES: FAD-dependent thymidylate synthase [unclassified Synechocystis]AIE73773.1 Thymidylate synthase thyX [Synechocystis sp. PCC 6714]MCT0252401.1 FAD-dependent thymidylate synthase [Synechocystis sp. CS-94]